MTDLRTGALLKTADVIALTQLSRTTLYRKRCANAFPKPCQIGNGHLRWRRSDIDKWIEQLPTLERVGDPVGPPKALAKATSRIGPSAKIKKQPNPEQGRLL